MSKDCVFKNKTFLTRHSWLQHEQEEHSTAWTCCFCSCPFASKKTLEQHLRNEHTDDSVAPIEALLNLCRTPHEEIRPCPLCQEEFSSFKAYGKHVARHLQDISLFSLPRVAEDESDVETNSWGRGSDHSLDASQEVDEGSAPSDDEVEVGGELQSPDHQPPVSEVADPVAQSHWDIHDYDLHGYDRYPTALYGSQSFDEPTNISEFISDRDGSLTESTQGHAHQVYPTASEAVNPDSQTYRESTDQSNFDQTSVSQKSYVSTRASFSS